MLLALAGGALLLVVLVLLIARGADGRYEVTAVFDQAFGLVRGGEVKAAGTPVGTIQEIALGADGLPRVRMAIDDDYQLRRGATAELRLFSLVGQLNRYVALEQGEGPALASGATIAARQTEQPVEFDELLETLPPATRKDIGQILGRLEHGVRGQGPNLDATLRESATSLAQTALLFDDVAADGDALRTLVIDGRKVVEALAADPNELGGVVDRLAPVLRTTAARQVDLSAGLRQLPTALGSMRSAISKLDSEIGDLRDLTDSARPAIAQLVPTSRRLRPALERARPVLEQARGLARDAPAQLRSLQPLIDGLIPTARRLDPTLDRLNPVLDQLRVRGPEVANFLTLATDTAANFDGVGHAVRVAGLLGEVQPRPLTDADSLRFGCHVRPFDRLPGVHEGQPWRDYEKSFVGGGKRFEDFDFKATPEGDDC